ncbi:MAG TPA: SRPBCC family protein [Pseudonocardiaceae bacterium]|jgi:hypothetical protein
MLNYEYEHSVITSASPDAILALWRDPASWPSWDTSVTKVDLDGPFAVGNGGTMHLAGQDPVSFTLTAIDESGFTDETPIPGGVLRFIHVVAPHQEGAVVTHRVQIETVQIEGGAEFAAQLGPAVTEDVPEAMAGLVALAEARRVPGPDADAASSVA